MSNQRMYDVVFEVTSTRLANYGKKIKVNKEPMTHKEARTFKSKMMSYIHGTYTLVEVKTNFVFATGHREPLKASTRDRRYPVL